MHTRAGLAAAIIAGAVEGALRDCGAGAIMILDAGTIEGEWLLDLCARHDVPAKAARAPSPAVTELLGGDEPAVSAAARAVAEAEAVRGNMLLAHPANRTTLLLATPPHVPLLPLGDVPASVVDSQRGGWTGPPRIHELAEAAGGVAALDAVLHAWLDRRQNFESAARTLPEAVARELRCAIRRGRFHRRRAGLVPKLGHRTIGHDLQF